MSKTITKDIRVAILKWLSDNRKTQDDIAEMIGVSSQSINQWISGKTYSINEKNWIVLEPLLYPYLSSNSGNIKSTVHNGNGNINIIKQAESEYKKKLINEVIEDEKYTAETKIEMIRKINEV